MTNKLVISTGEDLKKFLYHNYMNQIKNFFVNEKDAMRFLSSVMSSVQTTPKLLQCEPISLVNSFMKMAQVGLMPSDVSGEAYVIPYGSKATFQLGYQGLVTLFYRAGGSKIRAEIVREHDEFSYQNGEITHNIDLWKSNEERGKPVGAYAIAMVNGNEIAKAMNATDILSYGEKFSKSFSTKESPWKVENDPELWMWKKTVLKQLAKLLPKNETIARAIAEDNEDSIISDRIKQTRSAADSLKMGNFLKHGDENKKAGSEEQSQQTTSDTQSDNTGQSGGEIVQ